MGKNFRQVACQLFRRVMDERGSATIEAVIWVPTFALLLGLIADTSMVFGAQARALRVVQDANRALAVGHFTTTTETQDYVASALSSLSPNAEVTTTVTNGVISTVLTMPVADLAATGLVSGFDDLQVTVAAEFLSEV